MPKGLIKIQYVQSFVINQSLNRKYYAQKLKNIIDKVSVCLFLGNFRSIRENDFNRLGNRFLPIRQGVLISIFINSIFLGYFIKH